MLGERLVRPLVAEVGFEKAERLGKAFPRVRPGVVVAGELIDAFFEMLAEGVVREAFLIEADKVEGLGEVAVAGEIVERGYELAPGEVAGGTEDDQGRGLDGDVGHGCVFGVWSSGFGVSHAGIESEWLTAES